MQNNGKILPCRLFLSVNSEGMLEKMMEPLVAERFRNEEKYRDGHIRIINPLPGREIWGLHIPDMRKLARELAARDDAMEIVSGLERAAALGRGCEGALSHEEMTVWGMMINAMKKACRMELLRRYVPYIDNWAVCDTFDSGAGWFRKEAGAWDMLCGYFASGREFEVRFATVMSMSHFLDREYLPRIFFQFDKLDFGRIESDYLGPAEVKALGGAAAVLASGKGIAIGPSPYYVRMGVAWCLATALAKFPDDTRAYLRHSALPEDVLRLYVRKARESFRTRDVSPF